MRTNAEGPLDVNIDQFEGPLDLLYHLIEKNRIDIYDIPIVQITDQYIAYLDGQKSLDMEIASEFLLMAATLIHIKSRVLLPKKESPDKDENEDPREELVLKPLEYRRCKMLAGRLRERHSRFADCFLKLPETPVRLGIPLLAENGENLSWDAFWRASQRVARQNQLRFNDLSGRITHILKREKISVKGKMREIWQAVVRRSRLFFNELFPADRSSKAEQVTGFLALLELLRINRIRARQDRPFDVILLESDPEPLIDDDRALDRFWAEIHVEEKAYD